MVLCMLCLVAVYEVKVAQEEKANPSVQDQITESHGVGKGALDTPSAQDVQTPPPPTSAHPAHVHPEHLAKGEQAVQDPLHNEPVQESVQSPVQTPEKVIPKPVQKSPQPLAQKAPKKVIVHISKTTGDPVEMTRRQVKGRVNDYTKLIEQKGKNQSRQQNLDYWQGRLKEFS